MNSIFVDPSITSEVICVNGICYKRGNSSANQPTIYAEDVEGDFSSCDECDKTCRNCWCQDEMGCCRSEKDSMSGHVNISIIYYRTTIDPSAPLPSPSCVDGPNNSYYGTLTVDFDYDMPLGCRDLVISAFGSHYGWYVCGRPGVVNVTWTRPQTEPLPGYDSFVLIYLHPTANGWRVDTECCMTETWGALPLELQYTQMIVPGNCEGPHSESSGNITQNICLGPFDHASHIERANMDVNINISYKIKSGKCCRDRAGNCVPGLPDGDGSCLIAPL